MSSTNALIGAGVAPLAATGIVGSTLTGLTATGNNQGTALPIQAVNSIFTTVAASTGAILPVATLGDDLTIVNYGANALTVYPPAGGKLNNGATNAGVTVAAGKMAEYMCISGDGLSYAINASA